MQTINDIIKEIKDVPANRLDELYQFIHSLKSVVKNTESRKNKILSFSGIFTDMDNENYQDFENYTKRTRADLFDRNIEI